LSKLFVRNISHRGKTTTNNKIPSALLDDLHKELNIYAMRVKEWYGWHFPELVRIVPDNLQYAKVAKLLGMYLDSQA